LLLLSWLFPQYLQANFFWALVAGAVLGLSATFLESLFGLTSPIVSEKYPEIRQRVKDRQFYRTQAELARIQARETSGTHEATTARAIVTVAKGNLAEKVAPSAGIIESPDLDDADARKADVAQPTAPTAGQEA
jgi:hypothetical protein